jgi:putative NADH-flavin reductase
VNIAVIGANGKSGNACVQALVKAGHHVRAGVHYRSNRLDVSDTVSIHRVDATHPDEVYELIKNCDAIICLIGHVRGSPPRVQTDALHVIIQQMNRAGVKRLISLTGTGVRIPGDTPSFIDLLLNKLLQVMAPNRINDGKEHAELIQKSELEWTILRVLALNDRPANRYTLTPHGPAKLLTSRGEVADAIVNIVQRHEHLQECPVISKA